MLKVILFILCLIQITCAFVSKYVIEFEKSIHAFASKRHVQSKRSIFYEQLNAYGIYYEIQHEYQLINAVSIAFKSPKDVSLFLEKASGVKKAWPVNNINKPEVYQDTNIDTDTIQSLFGLYNQTGITQLRNELGIMGENIKVGVIDTGVDYTHPALGGCFGPDCRVAYGFDFVGDNYDGTNMPVPDNDPRDTCNGHGTHVTGIIAADDAKLNFTGVAPKVTIGAYRIFGCSGSSTDDIIMSAMEKAYLDGMDVVNLSLGDVGWPESPASLLADELALKGMIVCAAAGNEGERGIFQVGAPSVGKHAISIASVDNTHILSHTIQLQNDLKIGYTTTNGALFNLDPTDIVIASNEVGADRDGCDALSIDVKDKVVLFHRGGCMFSLKIKNAQTAGAVGVLIYNNIPGPVNPSVPDGLVNIPYGGLSKEDGYNLFDYLKNNPNQRQVTFLKHDESFPVPTAGTMSEFSSWGLGPDLSLKPDISAPGGQIYSTFPINLGGYATLSGTSMASPYVAGIVALILQSRGSGRSASVNEVRAMLLNNGQPFRQFESDQLESVARQGSGLINVYQAIRTNTIIMPEQIQLGDMDHHAENHEYTFSIKNYGRLATEYKIGHVSASSVEGYRRSSEGLFFPVSKPVLLSDHKADVFIPSPSIRVNANEQVNVTVRIAPPANANDAPLIYSGYIVVTNEQEKAQYVPYAGFTASLAKLPVLLVNDTMPSVFNTRVNAATPATLCTLARAGVSFSHGLGCL